MSQPTLRALSRAFAGGALDRESYRHQRRQLLAAIEAGEVDAADWHPPEPELRTVFPYDEDDGDTTQEILAPLGPPPTVPQAPPARRGRALPLLALAIVLGVGAWFAWQFFTPGAPPVPAVRKANVAPDLFERFIAANQWHASTLDAVASSWRALDEAQRRELAASPSLRQFTDEVLGQIQAQNALMNLGDAEEPLATQGQLLDLMDTLEVDDERLARARAAWRDARAAQAAQAATAATPVPAPPPPTAAVPPLADAPQPVAAPPAAPAPVNATLPAPTAAPAVVTPVAVAAQPPAAAKVAAAPAAAPPPKPTRNAKEACRAALAKTRRPYCRDALTGGGKGPTLVVVPAGEFEMGGEAAEEQPRHGVRIARAFALGLFEVSAAELGAFCKATGTACPAQPWPETDLPAVNVPWALAQAYAAWLSKNTGASYRLPSEAEWEYAARAGSTAPYPFGDEILPTHARYSFKAAETRPLPAGDRSVNRNDFKLYHMLGNVREWVLDAWQASHAGAANDGQARTDGDARRVARGGSYADRAPALRSAARAAVAAGGDSYTGFRVLREIE
ncbi:MAG: formylglycine-generating enzyme family protein [Gammaproteobacteria bacterium]